MRPSFCQNHIQVQKALLGIFGVSTLSASQKCMLSMYTRPCAYDVLTQHLALQGGEGLQAKNITRAGL